MNTDQISHSGAGAPFFNKSLGFRRGRTLFSRAAVFVVFAVSFLRVSGADMAAEASKSLTKEVGAQGVLSAEKELKAAIASARSAKAAMDAGDNAAAGDLLEARVAVRIAQTKLADKRTKAQGAAQLDVTGKALWDDISSASTPQQRREAMIRFTEYQKLMREISIQKTEVSK